VGDVQIEDRTPGDAVTRDINPSSEAAASKDLS
jgi:hypothetical protein